jgi:trehalose 6-phosphate phosphatase
MDALELLAAEPERAAILLDVDGTLAPIVADPEDARVPDATRHELGRLVRRYPLVACVSGRAGEAARRIVGVDELVYVGEHGLELDPAALEWAPRIADFAASTGRPAERKPLSVAFHYRRAPDRDRARLELEDVAAAARGAGFRTRWGRLVLEVLPPLDTSKGTAVRRLLEQRGLRRALYAGDDTTDLDAFAALDALELGVRVAVVSPESPPALRERAEIIVDSPAGLAALLKRL